MQGLTITVLTGLSTLAALASVPLAWSEAQPQNRGDQQSMQMQPGDRCQAMAEMRQQMLEQMRRSDEQLQDLAGQMRDATGDEKIEIMANLLDSMLAQRQERRQTMMNMHDRMLRHMMAHMAGAMPEEQAASLRDSMRQCPMMMGMGRRGGQDGNQPRGRGGR
ncbi:MAG: hypothetical protein ACF8R7_06165 [Phycisphaerales bacterium JB039]